MARKGDKDLTEKAKSLLVNHPEYLHNAKALFHNKNGETVIEDRVERGDKGPNRIMNQYDIDSNDLEALVDDSLKNIDSTILDYDEDAAIEDALNRSIYSMEDGRYAGKINSSTFSMLAVEVKNRLNKTPRARNNKEALDSNVDYSTIEDKKQEYKPESKEDTMDKEAMEKGISALSDAVNLLKTALNKSDAEKKDADGTSTEDKQENKEVLASTSSIVEALEVIANDLEDTGDEELTKVAFQLDAICDSLEGKEAHTIEGDADEPYMRKYFNGDVEEGDADEPYMPEYMEGDDTTGVEGMLSKKASEIPAFRIK